MIGATHKFLASKELRSGLERFHSHGCFVGYLQYRLFELVLTEICELVVNTKN